MIRGIDVFTGEPVELSVRGSNISKRTVLKSIRGAVAAGARFSTHLGNGLGDEIHRHRNPIWPQLAEDRLIAGAIADGNHLPAEVLRVITRAKETEHSLMPGGRATLVCFHLRPGETTAVIESVIVDGELQ